MFENDKNSKKIVKNYGRKRLKCPMMMVKMAENDRIPYFAVENECILAKNGRFLASIIF